MSTVRWGVLSTAKIATKQVIPAMQAGKNCAVTAIASRDLSRAQRAAAELGVEKAYGSYEEMLADAEIDAVYNPLPNHMHVDWSIKALAAGRHVLCEKPLGMDAADAEKLLTAAKQHPQLKVMEAFMYRHHPQWQKARELVTRGSIGRLRTIQSFFSYYNVDASNIRNQPEAGGGALMDIGCYPISLSRFLLADEPQRVLAVMERDANFGTDSMTSAVMEFAAGSATFTCSTQLAAYQRVNIFGSDGRVEIEIPFNAPPDRPCRLWREQGGVLEEFSFPVCDQYTIQGELFAAAVLNDTPVPTPLSDGVANMRVIDAVVESATRHEFVGIG